MVLKLEKMPLGTGLHYLDGRQDFSCPVIIALVAALREQILRIARKKVTDLRFEKDERGVSENKKGENKFGF